MEFDFFRCNLTKREANELNPLVLAFIGDAVYEVIIRNFIITNNRDMSVHKMHVKAVSYVKAHAQSEFMKKIIDNLNDEELRVFKRGRNAKSATIPKNANVVEYRMATGFEALIGYLFVMREYDRINEIMGKIINIDKGE
ncbi:mini-ribonuclease 3 [Clostridium tepidiprofundi DSM 19306]|uniref:Mini-ribonuclease 3 n=1 Tax=Clostridium tepidiprofundi DSM 19306 TaxID=1121338 RepID=A0A151B5H5_9CLOT|nr:Mini-ribonuclease 3 [Clostridium tepidiprofundi]KYH35171.1 mini-ribonuclease 3 [Clostridium tepidiprofundi DSM 19306]